MAPIDLTDSERTLVDASCDQLRDAEVALARFTMDVEAQRQALMQRIAKARQQVQQTVALVARAHGVDVSQPGAVGFDLDARTVTAADKP